MPELPDVEGFRRVLADHAAGHRIRRVDILEPSVLRDVSPGQVRERLRGKKFGRPRRHGKWLVAPVTGSDTVVLLHFGMTGSLHWADAHRSRHRHDRVVFEIGDGELRYRDMRKLQGMRLVREHGGPDPLLDGVGPDAMEVTREQLRDSLSGLRRQVKSALMDQSVIAGLGNLLADEILWRARVHPGRSCVQLGDGELGRLHARMRTVLRQSVEQGRVPPRRSWLTGRRYEESGVCPRCDTTLSHGRVGGRGTTWCPGCQPAQ